jgi:hypothetical protein
VDDADSNYLDRADVDAVKLTFTPPHATFVSTTRYRPNPRNRTTQSCVSFTSSGALVPSWPSPSASRLPAQPPRTRQLADVDGAPLLATGIYRANRWLRPESRSRRRSASERATGSRAQSEQQRARPTVTILPIYSRYAGTVG